MLSEIPQDELRAALDDLVASLLGEASIHQPPVDAQRVAQARGLTVAWDEEQASRARHVRLSGRRGAILLKPEPRGERLQWAIAHEVGEAVCHELFARLGLDPKAAPATREKAANLLANRLLVPTDWFSRDAADLDWDLLELKRIYSTASHELLARRMLDFDVPVVVTIFDHARQTFRRGNRGMAPRLSPAEQDLQRLVHKQGEPRREADGALTIQGWPIHEPRWKREILRTAYDEWE